MLKHHTCKGATDIVLLGFRGEFTRFENLENDMPGDYSLTGGGEIRGSAFNDGNENMPFLPPDAGGPFDV